MVQQLKFGNGMDKQFHPTLYNELDYFSRLGWKVVHVDKKGPQVSMHIKTCHITPGFTSNLGGFWLRDKFRLLRKRSQHLPLVNNPKW